MLADLALAVVATAVGVFIGTVGVGGVLLVPYLALYGGLGIHQAAATSLFTFLFTGILGTWLFQRRGSIEWRFAVPVCAGAAAFGYAGALLAAAFDPLPLAVVIALVIVGAGAYVLLPPPSAEVHRSGRGWREQTLLTGIGAVSGFGSGLCGAGGALFSVPLMVIAGYVPLAAVGASQVVQIVVALSGSIGNMHYGTIDFRVAALVAVFELVGVLIGVRVAHAVSETALRRLAGVLCIAAGGLLLARSL